MSSIRDAIKAADDLETELVEVPEWGGIKVEVRSMSAGVRVRTLKAARAFDADTDAVALYPGVVVECCYDPETGEKIFDPQDEEWLLEKSGKPLERLASVAMRLSALGDDAAEAGKDSSSPTPTSDTSSSLPSG